MPPLHLPHEGVFEPIHVWRERAGREEFNYHMRIYRVAFPAQIKLAGQIRPNPHAFVNTTPYYSILLNTTQYVTIKYNINTTKHIPLLQTCIIIQHQYRKLTFNTTQYYKSQYYTILHQYYISYLITTSILHQYYINTTSILHQYYINTTSILQNCVTLLLNATFLNTASILPNTTAILHQYYLDFVNTTSILHQYYINTTSILHNGISILQIAISILPQYYIEYFGLQYYPILPILPKFNTTKVVNTTQYYQYYQYY